MRCLTPKTQQKEKKEKKNSCTCDKWACAENKARQMGQPVLLVKDLQFIDSYSLKTYLCHFLMDARNRTSEQVLL